MSLLVQGDGDDLRTSGVAGKPAVPSVRLFGINIHTVAMSDALSLLGEWFEGGYDCHIVVTPNLDHVVQLQSNASMRAAYASASLVVADGWPLVFASRAVQRPLPERVPGSDLTPLLLRQGHPSRPLKVFLLGAAPGVAQIAEQNIKAQYERVDVCGVYSPPLGFEKNHAECQKIVHVVNTAEPDFLVVGLGAPKQEIWLSLYKKELRVKVAIAAGATIDFLAGKQTRAPRWVQAIHMEWVHRLATNPRRLAGRYLKDAVLFPWLLLKELF